MIDIRIITDGAKIISHLNDSDCNYSEVGSALLSLKQIEQILIDKEFEEDFRMEREND